MSKLSIRKFAVLVGIISVQISEAQEKELRFEDWIYEDNVKTVQLYPETELINDVVKSPVFRLGDPGTLILSFDVLYSDFEDYRVKLIHCNADWTKSFYSDLEFLDEYNEFNVQDYDFSFNTKIDYVHYDFKVPQVKLPGNYLLVVYKNFDEDDLLLTRRFLVYQDRVSIASEVGQSINTAKRFENQQIDFKLNYSGVDITNPFSQIKVVLRQNQRWDNAITNLRPTMVRESDKMLSYLYLNDQTNFQAGNEFRFFDIRTVDFSGQEVDHVERNQNGFDVHLYVDKSRKDLAYSEYLDINGKYVINNLDRGAGRGDTESEYATVNFYLESAEEMRKPVYIFGQLTDWKFSEDGKMVYYREEQLYKGELLLKQGWYNYLYLLDGLQPYYFEGIRFETENQYEILVYCRPFGARGDLLFGYKNIEHRNRR
jgi:hypothetical protein